MTDLPSIGRAVANLRADLEALDVTKSPLQREVERLRAENEQLRAALAALDEWKFVRHYETDAVKITADDVSICIEAQDASIEITWQEGAAWGLIHRPAPREGQADHEL